MSFEQNVGQADGTVQFISRGKGYTLFLTPTEAVFTLRSAPHPLPNEKKSHERFAFQNALREPRQTSVVRMKLLGVNSGARITGVEPALGAANYFIGRDPSKWHRGVPLYAKVQYSEVFPGIDLVYYGNEKQLEYDFVVKPGADPKSVSLGFEGTANSSLDASGNLALATGIGAMKLHKPVIYQMDRGQRREIEGKYILRRPNSVGVDVPEYDKTKPLIIDPVLSYSTYLGGSGDDGVYDLAVDSQGNAYVTGWTDSSNFPTTGTPITPAPNGTYVAFVAKLNPTATALVYSSYLGGTGGDFGDGIALDANGFVYLTGQTSSADFPVTANAYQATLASGATQNAYVSKLSLDGQSLLYSTYLGGGVSDGGYGIAVDANQNAYVAGLTMSGSPTPFPTTPNAFQTTLNSPNGNGFISRIDTTQSGSSSLVYSTYLGGSIAIANDWDQASAIAVDADQNVYVVGCASSPDFPVTPRTAYQTTVNPNGNAFLTRIDTTQYGSAGLIYSTIFGGTGSTDQASSVALDSAGKVYLTGGTGSGDFPTTTGVPNSGPGKVFVAKFDASKGSGGVFMMASRPAASSQSSSQSGSLIYSTLVGGSGGEFSYRVKVDPNGDAYISGWTWSNDFPVTPDAIQSTLGAGGQNSFVAALSPDGTQELFGTYLGGDGGFGDFAPGLALDPNYNIYVGGATQSTDLQTTSGAFQSSFAGTYDAFVAKLTALNVPIISSLSPTAGLPGSSVTINGLNFGSDPGTSTVTFNGDPAMPTSWSETQIFVPVPTDATTGNVVVTVNGLPSNGVLFTVVPPPPTLLSIVVSPQNPQIPLGLKQLFTATGNYDDGSTQDLTATATWSSSAPSVATISSTGVANPVAAGQTTIHASLGSVSASTTLTVPSPQLYSLAVQPAIPGIVVGGTQQFAVTGTYTDGSTQDVTASVTWSSANTGIASVSANGLATGIATGSTTITAPFGAIAKSANLTVTATAAPPSITASVSPAPDGNGWNNSSVTVTFTCTAGSSVVTTCPGPQTVSTGGTNQLVTGTATDANGLSATASVTLNIDKTPPALAFVPPVDGTTVTDPNLTVVGTVADNLSGASGVTCNAVAASFAAGAFSCNISLHPGVNLVAVRATDLAGNVAGANMHVKLGAPLPPPVSLQITPGDVNMLVGDTQQFTAVDELGRPRNDATWTVSDTSLATITTDSSPALTAVAVGQVTVTATVGSVSAQIQTHIPGGTSLSQGTTRWSVPPTPGFAPGLVVQAEPVGGGPDLYSVENDASGDINVRALTESGQQLWSALIPALSWNRSPGDSLVGAGDGSGGLLLTNRSRTGVGNSDSMIDLDGQTGTALWAYSMLGLPNGPTEPAIGPDGRIYFSEWRWANCSRPDVQSLLLNLTALDGTTGAPVALYPMGCENGWDQWLDVVNPVVGPDGTVFSAFLITDVLIFSTVATETLSLLQVSPDAGASTASFKTFTTDVSSGPLPGLTNIIPKGEGGALVSWETTTWNTATFPMTSFAYYVSNVSPGGASTEFASPYPVDAQVLAENNLAYGVGSGGVTAFDRSNGAIVWQYSSPSAIVNATAGGGVIINDSALGLVQLDASGNVVSWFGSPLMNALPLALGYFAGDLNNSFAEFVGPGDILAAAVFPYSGGNAENQHAPPKFDFELAWCTNGSCSGLPELKEDVAFYIQGVDAPHTTTSLSPAQINVIQLNALNAFRLAFAPYNVNVGTGRLGTNTVYAVGDDVVLGCGATRGWWMSQSRVFYLRNVGEAQWAVNGTDGSPTQALLQAIGEGIGNNAAHEIAHQLVNRFSPSGEVIGGMGLDDDSINTYNSESCSGSQAPWVYTGVGPDGHTPIHWGGSADQTLTNILGKRK